MVTSVVMVGTMAAIGTADHSCDESTDWTCVDGPALGSLVGTALAAPVMATGIAMTAAGYTIERRERQRASLSVGATGFRLTF